jgi:hypothetical protein
MRYNFSIEDLYRLPIEMGYGTRYLVRLRGPWRKALELEAASPVGE